MDTLTHIALGAVVGEAMAGKKIGKQALLLGAVAQSLPDIDFVTSFWMSFSENLLAHRGFTHSFLFVFITASALAFFFDRWYMKPDMKLRAWFMFWFIQMTIHLLIDSCNAYGVGWFEPFSHTRFAYHFLFVADPFFSFSLGVATVALLLLKSGHPARLKWVIGGLTISFLYLGYAAWNKYTITRDVKNSLQQQSIAYSRFLATPTPLNSWLWFIAVDADSGFYIGHRSVFDQEPTITYQYFPQNKQALDTIRDHESLQHLIRFSQGYYIAEVRHGKLIFSDLRFGQITGWATPHERFVFYYYVSHPSDNQLVIQRGRFANWNKEIIMNMIRRIRGKTEYLY